MTSWMLFLPLPRRLFGSFSQETHVPLPSNASDTSLDLRAWHADLALEGSRGFSAPELTEPSFALPNLYLKEACATATAP